MTQHHFIRLFMCGALLLAPLVAAACDVPAKLKHEYVSKQEGGYDEVLAELRDPACLGDKANDAANPTVAEFDKLTPDQARDSAARLIAAQAALASLVEYARNRSVGIQRDAWLALSLELTRARSQITAAAAERDAQLMQASFATALPRANWERLTNETQGALRLDGQTFKLLAPTGCKKADTSCPAFDSQINLVRVFNLVGRLRGYLQFDSLATIHADVNLQKDRWTAYRTKGKPLYFWEVWLNGATMGDELCPRDPGTGIQRGFCATPSSQWVLLHPEPVAAFNRKATQASELNAALLIELVGYHRWKWGEGSSEMRGRIGGSLAAAYLQHGGGRKWGYGPSFTWGEGSSLAVVRAPGGKWSVLLNLSLAGDYYGRKERYENYLKALKKPDFSELF